MKMPLSISAHTLFRWILAFVFVLPLSSAPQQPAFSTPAQNFQRLAALDLASLQDIETLALDGSYIYIGQQGNPGSILRVSLSNFSLAGELTLQIGERDVRKLMLDPAGGYLYAALENPGRIIRIRLSDFTRQDQLDLESGETGLQASVLDAAGGYLYLGTDAYPSEVIRIRLSDFTRQGSLTLPVGGLLAAALDSGQGRLYLSANEYPAQLIRVDLTSFAYLDGLVFPEGEDYFTGLALDEANQLAYLVSGSSPAALVKVDLSSFTRFEGIFLEPGDQYIRNIILDSAQDTAYLGAYTNPGRVIQLRLSDLSTTARVILEAGEGLLAASAADLSAQTAYYADNLDGVSLVKMELAPAIPPPGPDLSLAILQAPAAAQERPAGDLHFSDQQPGTANSRGRAVQQQRQPRLKFPPAEPQPGKLPGQPPNHRLQPGDTDTRSRCPGGN